MGRKKTNPVSHLFFTFHKERNESTCTVEGCIKPILKGNHSNNLETHIRSFHPNEYKILQAVKNEHDVQNKQAGSLSKKRQQNIDTDLFPSKVNIYLFN